MYLFKTFFCDDQSSCNLFHSGTCPLKILESIFEGYSYPNTLSFDFLWSKNLILPYYLQGYEEKVTHSHIALYSSMPVVLQWMNLPPGDYWQSLEIFLAAQIHNLGIL